jgi:hypothetical protein
MWLDRYKVVRRFVLLWACWLITITAMSYMENMGEINGSDAAVITGVIGILTIVIGFQKDDPDHR